VEVGAGHGKMAYLTLLKLLKMREFFPFLQPFKYIVTDFTKHNLDFWDAHPPLQPFFDAGLLDIAQFGTLLACCGGACICWLLVPTIVCLSFTLWQKSMCMRSKAWLALPQACGCG
jgi:hypothetical protein